jgi:ribosomal protein S18 acetylase RimI-like enzyme
MRSLVWSTDFDVQAPDAVVERREGYTAVRSPSNPSSHWGNLLLFDEPPEPGAAPRWEELFLAEVGDLPHRTFAWDRTDGAMGAADEFVARGYDLDEMVGLVATPADLRAHPRANRDVAVRVLDPHGDEQLWDALLELRVATRDEGHDEEGYRAFAEARVRDLRKLFRAGRGTWYVALSGDDVVSGCGIVVTNGRGRYQAVETASAHRRRGIASRLVAEAARRAAEDHGAEQLVIVADVGYHALGIYESLGFRRREHCFGACLHPDAR